MIQHRKVAEVTAESSRKKFHTPSRAPYTCHTHPQCLVRRPTFCTQLAKQHKNMAAMDAGTPSTKQRVCGISRIAIWPTNPLRIRLRSPPSRGRFPTCERAHERAPDHLQATHTGRATRVHIMHTQGTPLGHVGATSLKGSKSKVNQAPC